MYSMYKMESLFTLLRIEIIIGSVLNLVYVHNYEGESNGNLKSVIKIRNSSIVV